MKIVLFSLESQVLVACGQLSIAIEHVAAALLDLKNITVELVRGTDLTPANVLVRNIISRQPDCVGITTGFNRKEHILEIATMIHAVNPNIILFAGGLGIEWYGKQLLETNLFQFIVLGEGETAVVRAIKSLPNNLDDIPGVMTQNNPNPKIELEDLSRLQSPWLMGLFKPPQSTFFGGIKPLQQFTFWEIARGCFGRCSYCAGANMSKVRRYPFKRTESELDYIVARYPHIQRIEIIDATINYDSNRLEKLLRLFYTKGPHINWTMTVRPDLLSDKILDQFSKLSCQLDIGIQSLKPEVLALAHRAPINRDHYAEFFKKLASRKINYCVDMIIGLPGETPESYKKGIKYLLDAGVSKFRYYRLSIYPGTELYRDAEKLGLKYYYPQSKSDSKYLGDQEEVREYTRFTSNANMCDYQIYQTPTFTTQDLIDSALWTKNLFLTRLSPDNYRLI